MATGSFNAFFTPFFSFQVGLSMVQIGTLFAVGQAIQVTATLAAPLLVRRIGEARCVVVTVIVTAAMLLLLAGAPGRIATAFLYLGYVAFQYANEPSLFAWLMNHVSDGQRTRSAALLFVMMSVGGMLAAAVNGKFITCRLFSYAAGRCLFSLDCGSGLSPRFASTKPQPLADVLQEGNN